MLVRIMIAQDAEIEEGKFAKKGYEKIQLNYDIAYKAIKSLFRPKVHGDCSIVAEQTQKYTIDEVLINEALESFQLQEDDIDKLIKIANMLKIKTGLCRVKISLFEAKKDYQQAFMEHLNHESVKGFVFAWINKIFEKLKAEELEWKRENGLIVEVDEKDASAEKEAKDEDS